jgi:hypothetical protein
MRRLVTISEAMNHLRYDVEPPELGLFIEAASAAVLNYLGENASFLDDDGQVLIDDRTRGTGLVPFEVKAACLIWMGEMDQNREGVKVDPVDPKFGYGYPPSAVVALLAPLRDPRMA